MKLELLTNAPVVDDAIRLVSNHASDRGNSDNENQRHISYHQEKEEESSSTASTRGRSERSTTNQVF
jgi:hypothetical protein